MGKSTSLKVVSTTANKAGGSTPKSVSVAKKSDKKSLENASAVDLRQPKDRDPSVNNDSEIQELIASLPPLIDFGLSTHELIAIGYDYNSTKISFGNSIFNQWMEDHNDRWTQALPRFDSPFKDLYANYSVEVRVNMLFAQYANDWRRVLKFLISLFDDDALGKVEKNTEYTWGVRAIALQVAQQIPFSFFDFGLVNDSKVPQEDLYFLRDDRSNPALRNETPLVQFWLMCASIFDHPWTMLFDEFLEEFPIPCIQEIKLKVIEGFPNDETSKVDIHKGVKKIFDPDYEDSEEEDDPMGDEDTGLVNKFGQPDGWDSDETVDDNPNNRRHDMDIDGEFDSGDNRIHDDDDDKDEVGEEDEDTDESTKDSVILVENSYKTTDTENEEDTNYIGLNTDEVVSELTGVTGEDKDPELASPPRKKGRSHRVLVVAPSTEMDVDGSSLSETGAKRTHSPCASQSTTPTAQKTDTTSTKQSSKAKRRLQRSLTLEERLDGLRQVNLDGMIGQAILVELGMAYSYQGQQGGNTTHASIILNHILDTLADVLKNAEETIRFLPLSDSAYKKSKQWIRTEADLRRLIPDYRSLSKYLDMSFGNMSYASTSNKPGEKKLRTRMRVGFEVEVAAGTIRQYLHGELRPQGYGAGCYESVLQFGDIKKIGALCFYPQELTSGLWRKN
ncbi:unnamed protein product [Cylindrotheca closterium]|uniref:Uncharacterized protein n=1 Tax=Cylindrotheca closterium TaxID=2856 RepID=A0AAD2CGA1_9STRA|nr:unnamed protein product [Cylindrotheca closterium]